MAPLRGGRQPVQPTTFAGAANPEPDGALDALAGAVEGRARIRRELVDDHTRNAADDRLDPARDVDPAARRALVTVADMVMGVGSGHATGIRWPHPTVSLSTEFVRGARLGQWLEGSARVARRTINFCFCSCDLVCGGEIVLVASGVFKVPDVNKIPEAMRAQALAKWE